MFNKRLFMVAAFAVTTIVASQSSAAVSWDISVASGANTAFGWTGGQNNTDRFGDPTVDTTGFLFDNTDNFKATLGESSVTDIARVTIDVATALGGPASSLDMIRIIEWGTFEGDLADVGVQADFSIWRTGPLPPVSISSLSLPNDSTIFNIQDKTWYTERTLLVGDLPNWTVPYTKIQLTVSNTVQVNTGAPAGTFIEKDGMRIIVPEPGTCVLLAMAMIPLLRRRK